MYAISTSVSLERLGKNAPGLQLGALALSTASLSDAPDGAAYALALANVMSSCQARALSAANGLLSPLLIRLSSVIASRS